MLETRLRWKVRVKVHDGIGIGDRKIYDWSGSGSGSGRGEGKRDGLSRQRGGDREIEERLEKKMKELFLAQIASELEEQVDD